MDRSELFEQTRFLAHNILIIIIILLLCAHVDMIIKKNFSRGLPKVKVYEITRGSSYNIIVILL